MERFRSFSGRSALAATLVAGTATLIFATLLLGIDAIQTIRGMERQAADLYRSELLGVSHLKEAGIELMSSGRMLRQMVLAPTFVDRDQARDELDQAMRNMEQEVAAARQSIFSDSERRLMNEFGQQLELYKQRLDDAITLIDRSKDYQRKATAYVSGDEFNHVAESLHQLLHRMVSIKEEGARKMAVEIDRQSREARWLTLGLLAADLLFGAIAVFSIDRVTRQYAARRRHAIANRAEGNSVAALPSTDRRDDPGARQQSPSEDAQPVRPTRAELRESVDETPDAEPVVDEQRPAATPDSIAEFRGQDENREPPESSGEPHAAPVGRASILVVEGNESNHEVTAGLLANAGCQVTIASDGRQALQLLESSRYDMVLMDMQASMADGIDAALEIRRNPAFAGLSIIAMLANGNHEDRARCLAAGMDGHIVKPIDPEGLLRALMCWMAPGTSCEQLTGHRTC